MSRSTFDLHGIYAPIATPFAQGKIAYDRLERNLDFWLGSDLTGIVVMGSNGEFVLLSQEEKEELLRFVCARSKGKKPVVAGTGAESTMETIHLSRMADEAAADAVQMAGRLKSLLSPPYEVGLIHGRLPAEEKESVLDRFRKGDLHVLVGTTVVEVGVHVPGATVMIVEHPERFGLSQLHQLRGRVGRGSAPGVCYLIAERDTTERGMQRLNALVEHQDGFEIARKDMEQRGFGQLAGTMQAGLGEIDLSEMLREPELLLKAKRAVEQLLREDPDLVRPEHRPLRGFIDSMLTAPMGL